MDIEELDRRAPAQGSHRDIVRTPKMCSELILEVGQGVEIVGVVESFLIFSVTALDFAIMPWGIGPDEPDLDAELCSSFLV